jgi:lysophospholipase L1-like esterase
MTSDRRAVSLPDVRADERASTTQGMSRRRGSRFFTFVLCSNVLAFTLLLLVGELAVRWWREGSLGAAFASLGSGRPMPRDLGTGDWLQPDAKRGYVLRPGVHGTNSLGLRHPELASSKPRSEFRLLALGDSVAFPEDGFVTMVRAACGDRGDASTVVINAATPGYTTHQERLHLEALVEPLRPDAVLLQYCCNDNHLFLHQLTEEGGWLITEEARRALLPEDGGLWSRIARWSYLVLEVRRLVLANRPKDKVFPWRDDPAFAAAWREDSWPIVGREILRMREVAVAAGARFAVVAVPYEPQLSDAAQAADRELSWLPQRKLAAICAEAGAPFLDLRAAFEAAEGGGLYVDGIHLSPRGHAVAADAIVPFLRDHGLLR